MCVSVCVVVTVCVCVCVHVCVYTILQSTIPIRLIDDGNDPNTTMDKIVQVCCALVDLCPSVVLPN